jgi:hypothetical protein
MPRGRCGHESVRLPRATGGRRAERRRCESDRTTYEPDVQEHAEAQHAEQAVKESDRDERQAPDARSQTIPKESEADRHGQRRARNQSHW